jgi:hypothetical protein
MENQQFEQILSKWRIFFAYFSTKNPIALMQEPAFLE